MLSRAPAVLLAPCNQSSERQSTSSEAMASESARRKCPASDICRDQRRSVPPVVPARRRDDTGRRVRPLGQQRDREARCPRDALQVSARPERQPVRTIACREQPRSQSTGSDVCTDAQNAQTPSHDSHVAVVVPIQQQSTGPLRLRRLDVDRRVWIRRILVEATDEVASTRSSGADLD